MSSKKKTRAMKTSVASTSLLLTGKTIPRTTEHAILGFLSSTDLMEWSQVSRGVLEELKCFIGQTTTLFPAAYLTMARLYQLATRLHKLPAIASTWTINNSTADDDMVTEIRNNILRNNSKTLRDITFFCHDSKERLQLIRECTQLQTLMYVQKGDSIPPSHGNEDLRDCFRCLACQCRNLTEIDLITAVEGRLVFQAFEPLLKADLPLKRIKMCMDLPLVMLIGQHPTLEHLELVRLPISIKMLDELARQCSRLPRLETLNILYLYDQHFHRQVLTGAHERIYRVDRLRHLQIRPEYRGIGMLGDDDLSLHIRQFRVIQAPQLSTVKGVTNLDGILQIIRLSGSDLTKIQQDDMFQSQEPEYLPTECRELADVIRSSSSNSLQKLCIDSCLSCSLDLVDSVRHKWSKTLRTLKLTVPWDSDDDIARFILGTMPQLFELVLRSDVHGHEYEGEDPPMIHQLEFTKELDDATRVLSTFERADIINGQFECPCLTILHLEILGENSLDGILFPVLHELEIIGYRDDEEGPKGDEFLRDHSPALTNISDILVAAPQLHGLTISNCLDVQFGAFPAGFQHSSLRTVRLTRLQCFGSWSISNLLDATKIDDLYLTKFDRLSLVSPLTCKRLHLVN
jgi:hypothetical protein